MCVSEFLYFTLIIAYLHFSDVLLNEACKYKNISEDEIWGQNLLPYRIHRNFVRSFLSGYFSIVKCVVVRLISEVSVRYAVHAIKQS